MRLSRSALAISCGLLAAIEATAAEPSPQPREAASVASDSQKSGEAPVKSAREESVQNLPQFHARLLEIARNYETFGRVDDEYRWAPWLCRLPQPSIARFSASTEEATHGRKLYHLFAKDRKAYVSLPKPAAKAEDRAAPPAAASAPNGQVIVKESWTPKEVDAKVAKAMADRDGVIVKPAKIAPGEKDSGGRDAVLPYARREGKLYHASEKGALFIMFKVDPQTPETDNGWVYGTVAADGKKVTSAGKVSSCMGCHRDAPHDRQFGLNGVRE